MKRINFTLVCSKNQLHPNDLQKTGDVASPAFPMTLAVCRGHSYIRLNASGEHCFDAVLALAAETDDTGHPVFSDVPLGAVEWNA
ncbi:hypothetical protein PZ897_19790 [Hoeflea sp. YIM 152468]|uniref:hypothetical protein n=1 Tax=Hoeflea sp. YIM 152468 TaxID=3031759 RepID=UPI0023DCA184|nr:hypothetical protein [Hoeflea sp. YIM 152468]MDF1610429.1 hypothetical protein [Hoeflea sp. YIM 152468]